MGQLASFAVCYPNPGLKITTNISKNLDSVLIIKDPEEQPDLKHLVYITLTIKDKPLRIMVDSGSNRSFLGQPGKQLVEQLALPITRIT